MTASRIRDSSKGIKNESFALFMLNLSILTTVVLQFFIESGIYPLLRISLYLIFILTLLSIISANPSFTRNSFLNFYTIVIYLSVIFFLLISFFKSELILGALIEFAMPFVILYMGFKSNANRNQMSKLILRYMISVTVLGVFVVFFYGSGFQISGQYYFSSKNQVGPFIASVAMVSLISFFGRSYKTNLIINKNVLIIIFIINIASLLALRNRSGIVALGVCLLVFLLSKIKMKKRFNKGILLMPITIIVLSTIVINTNIFDPVVDTLYRSFFLNYDTSDLNSLSAGRADVYMNVLQFLKTSPFFGELYLSSNIFETPHNYLLNSWLNYGLLGVLPITIFYIYLWVFVIFKIVIKKKHDLSLYLILFMVVISIFEYTYPFGPLTTVSISWLLLGYYLKNNNNSTRLDQTAK
ncbi:O-antigen ligase family protein [Psychrobacillus sp. NPDC093180]|uniref:O-antigen ligase family protein n=1 Tax=Psychrobacillus sp. NPDC093180 TaxID=3364489 RepID=UPI00381E641D